MPSSRPTLVSPRVTELLNQLRRRIRGYVWLEGIAFAVSWISATFWIGLALDYLPVRMGASEMPVAARAALLACIGAALLYILYRFVMRRAFVRLRNPSLAVLVERQFPQFQDSLVTAVELDEARLAASPLQRGMLQEAREQADRHVGEVQLTKVFNYWPLRRAVALAGLSAGSIALLALFCGPIFGLWVSRLYGLSEVTYPRQTYLEMIGFPSGQATVARGSDVTIRVRADAARRVPEICTILYRTKEGERGRVNMSKKGAAHNDFQQYTFTGKPFKSILNDIVFDVVGNDQRIRDQRVRVVDSPQIVAVHLACDRPAYTQLTSVDLVYYPGISLPRGSHITVRMEANKPLVEARLKNLEDESQRVLKPAVATGDADTSPYVVTFDIPSFDADLRQEITLLDTDQVTSNRPYRLAITATTDQPPEVAVRLRGIGSAITNSARLPVTGEISDDYGVARAWFQLELPEATCGQFELDVQPGGRVDAALDLREQRAAEDGPQMEVDSKILLSVRAADLYDLEELPNTGQGDRYELEVVTPNRLIALLEARELGLRRRFEQIISEMQETRDSLSRVQFAEVDGGGESLLLDEIPAESGSPEERARRAASLRMLRVQRAEQYSQRAAQEVLGVALSFDDIRQELINNRVDASDRRDRIQREISQPLQRISEELFPILDTRLAQLRQNLESEQPARETLGSAAVAVAQADEILVAMEAVLDRMLDLETYNELVDLIRAMIRDQEDLTKSTKQQQKKSALELLK